MRGASSPGHRYCRRTPDRERWATPSTTSTSSWSVAAMPGELAALSKRSFLPRW